MLIGSPTLAAAVSVHATTQFIRHNVRAEDDGLAKVATMIFGTRDASGITALHRASGGGKGAFLHGSPAWPGLEPP